MTDDEVLRVLELAMMRNIHRDDSPPPEERARWRAALAAVAALQAERDALRVEEEHNNALIQRQSDLLTGAVNVLRGDPPSDTLWSHHDVAELAREMKARAERAESALEALRGQVEGLRQFASAMMERWPMGDVDGGDLQNEAVNAGLLREVVMTDFCGESCSCAEYATRAELPVTCYRRTTLLTGKPESDERIAALLAMKNSGEF